MSKGFLDRITSGEATKEDKFCLAFILLTPINTAFAIAACTGVVPFTAPYLVSAGVSTTANCVSFLGAADAQKYCANNNPSEAAPLVSSMQ
ncbi:MAG TPA: hypothetical protein VJK30_06360 [Coxiellaceae bacterium]|nr:MAG: hypothetical protein A3E81_05850 [Gammaproteobacteria bacterium RIFCSPHIGHO2_12_FULL_36_30]HLB56931.1 hypothetical protein [Coxiellaceae bacterium]